MFKFYQDTGSIPCIHYLVFAGGLEQEFSKWGCTGNPWQAIKCATPSPQPEAAFRGPGETPKAHQPPGPALFIRICGGQVSSWSSAGSDQNRWAAVALVVSPDVAAKRLGVQAIAGLGPHAARWVPRPRALPLPSALLIHHPVHGFGPGPSRPITCSHPVTNGTAVPGCARRVLLLGIWDFMNIVPPPDRSGCRKHSMLPPLLGRPAPEPVSSKGFQAAPVSSPHFSCPSTCIRLDHSCSGCITLLEPSRQRPLMGPEESVWSRGQCGLHLRAEMP